MNCTQCKDPGADCIAKDGTRLCQTCLYERVEKERDELLVRVKWAEGEVAKAHAVVDHIMAGIEPPFRETAVESLIRLNRNIYVRMHRDIASLKAERDEALEAVAQERADAVAWMRRAADYVVTRRLMRECGCKPDDEAAKAARQCADAIEKGKHVGAAGEKK